MKSFSEKLNSSVEFVRSKLPAAPAVAVVLGSGLSSLFDTLPVIHSFATARIPNFPLGSVEGHKGMVLLLKLGGQEILVFQGRTHFYEHRDTDAVLYPIYLMHLLGVRTLVVTNAAGGVNRAFSAGDIMIIRDHINLTGLSVPFGGSESRLRHAPYSERLVNTACSIAPRLGLQVKVGVYAGVKGPSYETAAEVEMIRRIGGDAVGMSTVLEVELASHLGTEVLGISCITNLATGISSSTLSHQEVTDVAHRVKSSLSLLLTTVIAEIQITSNPA